MFTCSSHHQRWIGLGLMAFMLATRFHHFGDALHLPDASWAIFFAAGFYLAPGWLLAFLVEAVAIDGMAVGWLNVSAYCLTPAYVFLLVAYGLLWQGGRWLARRQTLTALLGAAGLSVALAFVLSNASFYWLGGQVAQPTWAEFAAQFLRYLPMYLGVAWLYIGVATVAHLLLTQPRAQQQRT
jgi:hypothetical protein